MVMRLVVNVRFADGHAQDVTLDITDPAMILNDETGTAGKVLGGLVLGDLIEAHGPVVAPPRPVRRERDDDIGGPVAAGRSARSIVAAARPAA